MDINCPCIRTQYLSTIHEYIKDKKQFSNYGLTLRFFIYRP